MTASHLPYDAAALLSPLHLAPTVGVPFLALLDDELRYIEDHIGTLNVPIVGAQVRRTTNQAIADGPTGAGWQSIVFDTVDGDSSGYFDSGSSSRLTIVSPGFYLCSFSTNFAKSGAGTVRGARIYLNGTSAICSNQTVPVGAGFWWTADVMAIHIFSQGDYIEAQQYQDTGANLNVEAGTGAGTADQQAQLAVVKLGVTPD